MGWRLDGDYQMIKMHKFSVVKLLEFNKIKKMDHSDPNRIKYFRKLLTQI